jgi:putative toxin-antitoxin system antitoxin component (TIGR02293 family)
LTNAYLWGVKTYQILEDETYLKAEEPQSAYMVAQSRQGIPYSFLEKLSAAYHCLSPQDLSKILHVSERTLHRYEKDQRILPPPVSEKLLQLSMLFKAGLRVFEDIDAFNQWLSLPNIALGQVAPKSLLDTHFGIKLVQDVLFRLEHGVFS